MGTHFALTYQLPLYRNDRRTTRKSKALKAAQTSVFGFALALLLAGSVFAYLIQVNTFSTQGYVISKLQNQVKQLQDQHDNLEAQTAQLQSIGQIQNDPAVVNMVPVSQMTYIQSPALSQR